MGRKKNQAVEESAEYRAYRCRGRWQGEEFIPQGTCPLEKQFFKPGIECCLHCVPVASTPVHESSDASMDAGEYDLPIGISSDDHDLERYFNRTCRECYNCHAGMIIRRGLCVGKLGRGVCPNHVSN